MVSHFTDLPGSRGSIRVQKWATIESTWHLSGFVKAAESLEKRRVRFCIRGLKAHAPEDTATELRIGLYKVTELVRQYQDSFEWAFVPIGKLRPR